MFYLLFYIYRNFIRNHYFLLHLFDTVNLKDVQYLILHMLIKEHVEPAHHLYLTYVAIDQSHLGPAMSLIKLKHVFA